MAEDKTGKDGKIPPPNYTQIPNLLLDELVPEISTLAELKIVLVIARQTFGYHKRYDQLSISQLMAKTGLHRASVVEGVKAAVERGLLKRKASGQSYLYALNVRAEVVQNLNRFTNQTSSKSEPVPVQNLNHLDVESSTEFEPTKESTLKENIKESTPTATAADFIHGEIVTASTSMEKAKRSEASNAVQYSAAVPDVELIYANYPRHIARKPALAAIKKALKEAVKEMPLEYSDAATYLLDRTKAYANHCRSIQKEQQFIPHPATWFNQARYLDEFEKETNYVRTTHAEQQSETAAQLVEFGERCIDLAGAAVDGRDSRIDRPDAHGIRALVAGRLRDGANDKNVGDGFPARKRTLELCAGNL